MQLPDMTVQKGSVKLVMKRWESASALTPSLAFQRLPAPQSLAPEKTSRGSSVEEISVESGRMDVTKEEPLGGPRQTDTFPISVKELQSHFETLGRRKEAESGRSSLPPALTTQPGSQTDISLMEMSSVKWGRAIFEKMSSGNGQTINTEVDACKAVGGLQEESPPHTGNTLMEFQENVSLKDKMALYQAAVSKAESSNRFADENSSTTQLPLSSSTREAECSATATKEAPLEAFQSQEVSLGEQVTPETNGASTLTQHTDEAVINAAMNKEVPKTSTDVCDHQMEKTTEENTVPKDRETATSAQDGKFPRCTETLNLRKTEDKCPKGEGYPDQTIPLARPREALRQPRSNMPSAAARMRAMNEIIKGHGHSVRRPRHQGAAGLPVQSVCEEENPKVQRGDICSEGRLPKPKEPQMREPLRVPKSKSTCAASRIKAINDIHRNLKHSQRRPNQEGAAFLVEDVQGLKTTDSNLKNKDASFMVYVLCSNAQQVDNKEMK
ncbi:uncharacterized protein LOC121066987 [Cygnus olor]|uniref:uncharacterized protein LOC121066987 n=1 Tax=Cygnus olor TaxID=8869 RepID=UPI001ADE4D37|nr:uncharacterized protein LOC121066987 [Cygnus olor]